MPRAPRPLDLALFLALGTIWSSTYLLTKLAVATIPPFGISAIRCGIGGAILVAILPFTGQAWPRGLSYWVKAFAVTICSNGLPIALVSIGMARVDSGLGAILVASAPLMTLLIVHLFTPDEAIGPAKLIGVTIGFAGIVMLVGWEALGGLGQSLIGQAAMLGVALCYAIAAVTARALKAPALANGAATLLIACVQMTAVSLLLEVPWLAHPSGTSLAAAGFLGAVNGAVATVIYFHLATTVGATFVALNNYVNPPLAVLWGALLFGEAVSGRALGALALIFVGISVANPDALRAIFSRGSAGPRPVP